MILGFAGLISGQYAPPFRANPQLSTAQAYGPPELMSAAPLYGLPAPPPSFTPLVPPLVTSETNLVPPQLSPSAPITGLHGTSSAQHGLLSGFTPAIATAGPEASTSAQTNAGRFSLAANPQLTRVPAPPSSPYGTPSF